MTISIIVAVADNGAIGINGKLPWHLPNDMKFFKNTTWAMPVLMGRRTWESLGKPLPGRANIVISRNPEWKAEGAEVVSNVFEAIENARQLQTHEAFVIGGGQIYEATLTVAERIYLTRVHASFDNADTFFQEMDWDAWTCKKRQRFEADDKNAFAHTIEIWERKKS